MTKPPFVYTKRELLFDQMIFVDGLARSGKMLTCETLSRLRNVDYFQTQSLIEWMCYLWFVGGIKKEFAMPFLQTAVDELIYYRAIGRQMNMRLDDHSSIMKAPKPEQYILRSVLDDRMPAVERFKEQNRIPVFLTHSALQMADLFMESFPKAVIVHSNRHPVDQTIEWELRGWGRRETTDPLAFMPLLETPHGNVPWFAGEWPELYLSLNPMETAVESVLRLHKADNEGFMGLNDAQQKRIYRFSFELLVTEPQTIINDFCGLFDTERLPEMNSFLLQEDCPRELGPAERKPMLQRIRKNVSDDVFERLISASRVYEETWGLARVQI